MYGLGQSSKHLYGACSHGELEINIKCFHGNKIEKFCRKIIRQKFGSKWAEGLCGGNGFQESPEELGKKWITFCCLNYFPNWFIIVITRIPF